MVFGVVAIVAAASGCGGDPALKALQDEAISSWNPPAGQKPVFEEERGATDVAVAGSPAVAQIQRTWDLGTMESATAALNDFSRAAEASGWTRQAAPPESPLGRTTAGTTLFAKTTSECVCNATVAIMTTYPGSAAAAPPKLNVMMVNSKGSGG